MSAQKEDKNISVFLNMMLVTSGVDIIAPQEVQEEKLQALGLTGDEGFEYQAVVKILNNVPLTKRVKVLKAAIATTLPPTQMLAVRDDTQKSVKAIIEYTKDHPEVRENVAPEDALERMLGIN